MSYRRRRSSSSVPNAGLLWQTDRQTHRTGRRAAGGEEEERRRGGGGRREEEEEEKGRDGGKENSGWEESREST
jgi:hypothetical protein